LFPENECHRVKRQEIRRVCEFDGESQALDLTRSNNVAISLKAFRIH
jgi:hypothetical protein